MSPSPAPSVVTGALSALGTATGACTGASTGEPNPAATPLMTLAQAHALLPGATLVGDGNTPLWRVHSDTRSLQAGDLFVALRGERFDAHDFLPQARAAGAAAALAERGLAQAGLPGLLVSDALAALQQLATAWRQRLHLPLIAVAGSNGKTTVTQMVAAILRAWLGDAALATAGNYNNHIGVPLTVLRLRQDAAVWHRAAVLELGMNHPGEIARLAAIAQPTVALVNNAQREHQEFMATVAAVALENGAVIHALPATGTAVFPADDAHSAVWLAAAGERAHLTFAARPQDARAQVAHLQAAHHQAAPYQAAHPKATTATADVQDEALWVAGSAADGAGPGAGVEAWGHWVVRLRTPAGPVGFNLHAAGQHNLRNALAAATSALAAGAPLAAIAQGLAAFRPVAGRSQTSTLMRAGRPVLLVNDSYNANPDSVRAAIDLLAGLAGPRWLVLGDMGEVGDQGPAFHAEVGAHARSTGIEQFWAVGALCADAAAAFGPAAQHFHQVPALINALHQAPAARSVLVKGSRFMRMETVVAALARRGGPAALVQPQLKDGHAA